MAFSLKPTYILNSQDLEIVSDIVWDSNNSGVRFTTHCRALRAGLSLTLDLTTNSTVPVSQPLSCISFSCANLSLSLTSQIFQWSSSIETTSSDQSVNRKLQVLSVSSFIESFLQADHIYIPQRWKYIMLRHKEVFVAVFCFGKVALASILSPSNITMLYLSQSERRLSAKCSNDMS